MVEYNKYHLANGLTLVTHVANDTPLATVNILYNVGSRDEDSNRTGFAHLFEHLMFGGTKEVPDFDMVVNSLGGESNAFTNSDYTNYYITLPAQYLAEALHLEKDRMFNLDISAKALDVQQKVVTEEYNQRYINRPYGDIMLLQHPLTYDQHPYRWATIGADIRHVSEATLEDVRSFHAKYYRPDNAILSIAAPLSHEKMLNMVLKEWQTTLDKDKNDVNNAVPFALRSKSVQVKKIFHHNNRLSVERNVPASRILISYPIGTIYDPQYNVYDVATDLLAGGQSSRFFSHLVQDDGRFTYAEAVITDNAGPNVMLLYASLTEDISTNEAEKVIINELKEIAQKGVSKRELEKVVNNNENTHIFSQYKASERAMKLCHYTWLGDTDLINTAPQSYREVTIEMVQEAMQNLLNDAPASTLYYLAK